MRNKINRSLISFTVPFRHVLQACLKGMFYRKVVEVVTQSFPFGLDPLQQREDFMTSSDLVC